MNWPQLCRVVLKTKSLFLTLSLVLLCSVTNCFAQTSKTERPVARLISSSAPTSETHKTFLSAAPIAATSSAVDAALAELLERTVFDMLNEMRRANGATPLVWDDELHNMARRHSEDMARRDFFSHETPEGFDVAQRARLCSVKGWQGIGENIAYNSGFDEPGAMAVERWMKSTKHRTNILDARFTHTALGVAQAADGRLIFTQVFIMR